MSERKCAMCGEIRNNNWYTNEVTSYCLPCQKLYDKYHREEGLSASEIRVRYLRELLEAGRRFAESPETQQTIETPTIVEDVDIRAELIEASYFVNSIEIVSATKNAIVAKYESREAILRDISALLDSGKTLSIKDQNLVIVGEADV